MITVRAPGRVNLMGDHTDHQDGLVLPAAIDRECVVTATPTSDGRVVARSQGFAGLVEVAADGRDDPRSVKPAWGRILGSVVDILAQRGRPPVGAELEIRSSVPPGSGLSSSAAFEVAVATALCEIAAFVIDPVELARACQEAEQAATGVPCGIMDQLAAVAGEDEHVLLIDCRSLSVLPVPFPTDLVMVVVHSGVTRRLTDTPYAIRRRHCQAVAADLGLASLRDTDPEQPPDDRFARHVVTENARVPVAALALAAGDLDTLAEVFDASHASLRDDYACSTPEIDALVERLVGAGAIGARLTGAGWGGCVVALAERPHLDQVIAEIGGSEVFVCRPGAGVSRVEP